MNRLATLTLGVVTLTWATGCCCHSYQSRCVDWDDGCSVDAGDNCRAGCRRHRDRHCRDERCREERWREERCRDDRRADDHCCCPADCCEVGGAVGTYAPSGATYDSGAMMGGSCAGCAGGIPGTSGPVSGGCASGNCGTSLPTYGGLPIDPSSGWTISPAVPSGGSEPIQAPPAGSSPTPATPSSAITPVPMPISPPVGSAR